MNNRASPFDADDVYPLKLNVRRFEGCTCRYPMAQEKDRTLYWTIEHHATKSRGGYEVFRGRERAVFHHLEDAIKYYNGEEI